MDSHQAIYDAVRSRLSNCDVGSAIERVAFQCFDISHARDIVTQEYVIAAAEQQRPSVLFRPRVFIDGEVWCAIYGDNLQDGVAGFGPSPDAAMRDFDTKWRENLAGVEVIHAS